MIHEELTVTEAELRDILGLEPDETTPGDIVGTCAGEWRREGDVWRAYSHPEG